MRLTTPVTPVVLHLRDWRAVYAKATTVNRCAWAWGLSDADYLLLAVGHGNVNPKGRP